jgi:hypothetical protein
MNMHGTFLPGFVDQNNDLSSVLIVRAGAQPAPRIGRSPLVFVAGQNRTVIASTVSRKTRDRLAVLRNRRCVRLLNSLSSILPQTDRRGK